jgi:5-methylcytosine-specific restriction endonuclease McrA
MEEVCRWPACNCRGTGVYCSSKRKSDSNKRKRKAIPRRSKKGLLRAKEKQTLIASDMVLYLEIWSERPHICYECEVSLGNEAMMQFFHHLLIKSGQRYGHLRHERKNIVLLCWACHDKVTGSVHALPKTYELYLKTLSYYGL